MLNDFSREILEALERAAEPLSASEIADRMSEGDHRQYVGSYVTVYLRYALQDYVQKVEGNKWIRIKKIKKERSSHSSDGRDRRFDQNAQSELAGDLESLDRSIIKLLTLSDESLKAWEIAERLSSNSRLVSKKAVNKRLYGVLEDLVHQDLQYRWSIKEDYREHFADSLAKNITDPADEERSGNREKASSLEDLVCLIQEILKGPARPLKTYEVTEYVRSRGHDVSQSEVGDILSDHLDGEAWFVPKLGWCPRLRVNLQKVGVEATATPEMRRSDTDSKESMGGEGNQESSGETSGFSPDGIAARVSTHLETAKSIVTILDLAPRPLSTAQLATVLRKLGYQREEEEIEVCLRSILSCFVVEPEGGRYRLALPADSDSSKEKQPTQPVDADTRASLPGSVYTYRFVKGKHDAATLFSSEVRGGTVHIELNTSHPLFEDIRVVLNEEDRKSENPQLEGLESALRILIAAWVDVESNLQGRPRDIAEELRTDWGRTARLFLRSDSGS